MLLGPVQLLHMSLYRYPMLPRITQESYRPRVSDRTMGCQLQPLRLSSFKGREASSRQEDATRGTEKPGSPVASRDEASCQDREPKETSKPSRRLQGLDAEVNISSASGRGGIISLDFSFYRTALMIYKNRNRRRMPSANTAPLIAGNRWPWRGRRPLRPPGTTSE